MLININVFTKNNHIFQNFKNIMNRVVLFYMTANLFDVCLMLDFIMAYIFNLLPSYFG